MAWPSSEARFLEELGPFVSLIRRLNLVEKAACSCVSLMFSVSPILTSYYIQNFLNVRNLLCIDLDIEARFYSMSIINVDKIIDVDKRRIFYFQHPY